MSSAGSGAGVPAAERVVVGLCHALNDQLAAIAAYVYLLEKRGGSDDLTTSLQGHLDRLAHVVRLIRSLSRGAEAEVEPFALTLLAEFATELMEAYPDGTVVFTPRVGDEATVIRSDWTRTLRSLLAAAAWVSRGVADTVHAELGMDSGDDASVLQVTALGDMEAANNVEPLQEPDAGGITFEQAGERAIRIRFPTQV